MFSFEQAVAHIDSRIWRQFRDPQDPPPLLEAFKRLDMPFPYPEKTIIIAGTNGKGSVAKTIETLLLSARQKVGLFTSPHLKCICERIRSCNRDISKLEFTDLFNKLEPLLCDLKLTHFEMLTVMACWYYFSPQSPNPCEWSIFEVGLGGIKDPTNFIPHHHAIITKIGYDHQGSLGNTLVEIAEKKLGIVKNKNNVVHFPFDDCLFDLAEQTKTQTQSSWTESKTYDWTVTKIDQFPTYSLSTPWGKAKFNLPGQRGAENTSLALNAFKTLGFDPTEYLFALENVSWPGRMSRLNHPDFPCPVYLSGDHNEQGIDSLCHVLSDFDWNQIHIIAGAGKTKNINKMLEALSQIRNNKLWLTTTPFRGKPIDEFRPWLKLCNDYHPDPLFILNQVKKQAQKDDLILVTGSLYLVGYILEQFSES